jgi:predicted histidine transporter YuiF (NhaC family)
MKTETKFRIGIVMSLLGLIIMTFEYFEKDRVYQELKISSSKQIDSLKEEIEFKDDQIGKYEMAVYEMQQETPIVVNKVLKNIGGLSYEK